MVAAPISSLSVTKMRKLGLGLLVICLPLAAAGDTYGKLPLSFEPNQGQADARVKFLARVSGYTLFVTGDEAVFAGRDGSVERMKLIGANRNMRMEPLDKQPGISNYFIGNDPTKWRTNIPNYGRVALREVYPGIDLIFYSNERQLEYDWVVALGADPKQIHVKWEGPGGVTKNAGGDLVLSASLVQRKPVILQEGKRIEGGYIVRSRDVAFELAKYDAAKPLVIDPVLVYSTYLGGGGSEFGNGIAVDGAGNAYVTGDTSSTDFPTTHPLPASNGFDVFVTKINPAGSALVYSTYLGGSEGDEGLGIAVDGAGNAYITGETTSTNFPTNNPLQARNGGVLFGGTEFDAFVTKINAAGSALVYSTYLGGSAGDEGLGIAVDGSGNAYITGYTMSRDFPTANPLQASSNGQCGYLSCPPSAFVTKINAAGSAYVYSTYLGGSAAFGGAGDVGNGIAVDSSGNAYVAGYTTSTDFPTANAVQAGYGGGVYDAFVTKINATGSALVYSTFLGGSLSNLAGGIAVDGSGNAYVTGYTISTNFPTVNPLQASNSGGSAFVTKINAAGSAYVYSTYVGVGVSGGRIAVDGTGNAYLTGATSSTNFPITSPLQASYGGGTNDAFVAKINATGSAYVYSTYLGGSGIDQGQGIAVDGSGNVYVTGYTESANFPTASPLQPFKGGPGDAFVLSISAAPFTTKNSASYELNALAPDMIAFGEVPGIAAGLMVAPDGAWPTTLGDVHLDITDSQGQTRPAPLYFVTTNSMAYLIPAGTAPGLATAKLSTSTAVTIFGTLNIADVAPGLYTAKSTGSGVAAGLFLRRNASGEQSSGLLFDLPNRDPLLVDLGAPTDQVFLSLYGTGFRGAKKATASVGGVSVAVAGFAATGIYQGEDVVNVGPLPRSLAGNGVVAVVLTFDDKPANTVSVGIR